MLIEGDASTGATIRTLVEVQGGPECWAKADEEFARRGWPTQMPAPRDDRIARREYGAGESVRFRWVDIPVPGSPRRAENRAAWMVGEAGRKCEVTLYDRRFWRVTSDRTMQPAWRVYSTRHFDRTVPPTSAASWSRPLWWVRAALYRSAVRVGLYDLDGERVSGSREAALCVARELSPGGPRTDVDVRPLDGLGRQGAPRLGEKVTHQTGVIFTSTLIAAGLLLCVAREAPPAGMVLFGALASLCAAAGWLRALALPLGRTRTQTVLIGLIITAFVMAWTVGVPGLSSGFTRGQSVVLGATAYYLAGLILLVQRWRWQGLLLGALPILVTLVVAALPVTRTLLHDAYADELSLTPAETSVSTIWQIAAAVELLWPTLLALLGIGAGWGLLRYFHYVRGYGVLNLLGLASVTVLAVLQAITYTLDSPAQASAALKRAAEERTDAPGYFGVQPEWMCTTPTVPRRELNEKGGLLNPRLPYLSFGVIEGQVVLWNVQTGAPLRVSAQQIRLTPSDRRDRPQHTCRVN